MSLAEEDDEFQLSRCAEEGCDEPVTHLEQRREGHRLTCGNHADEEAVPLDVFDFDYRGGYGKEDRPDPINQLESVAHQVCEYWQKETTFPEGFVDEERDERSISIVVRDGDGELIGESQLWDYAGTYALVRFQPNDVEDLPESEDPPEPPEWAEWIHSDPPVHHHVEGVQCSGCGQSEEFQFPRMPSVWARREPWDRIHHRADCSQATRRDKKRWWGRQYAIEVRARPSPRLMALDCIWDELRELREERGRLWAEQAVEDRHVAIFHALEERMQTNYPRCPECGGEIENTEEWMLECRECYESIGDETYQEWWEQHRRLWGTRGQGDRGWGPEEDVE